MAEEGKGNNDDGGSKGKMVTQTKHVIKWEDDSDSNENLELALCLVRKLWTTKRFNSNAFMKGEWKRELLAQICFRSGSSIGRI